MLSTLPQKSADGDQCSETTTDHPITPDPSPELCQRFSSPRKCDSNESSHVEEKISAVPPEGNENSERNCNADDKRPNPDGKITSSSSFSSSRVRAGSGLKDLYAQYLRPIEELYFYPHFACGSEASCISDDEWTAPPQVLLLGQYSTGKTTFVKYLTGEYPGIHIGSEPTTDKFVAVMGERRAQKLEENGNRETKRRKLEGSEKPVPKKGRIIKGNSLTVTPGQPYSGLSTFGSNFLDKFEAAVCPITTHPLLDSVTFIDTPGILSGEKQRIARSYDFADACRWFANRADLVLLLFDAHKLDISDEFREVMDALRPHSDKVRCVLNKADQVSAEELVRVFGSLMWSMGKILGSPEVVRVYTGSYWEGSLIHDQFRCMFDADESLLINELKDLPNTATSRRINELVRRVRKVKVHVCLLSYLRGQMPLFFGKKTAQETLVNSLPEVFRKIRTMYSLSEGDFPNVKVFASKLRYCDFRTFPTVNRQHLKNLDDIIQCHVPHLLTTLGENVHEEQQVLHHFAKEDKKK
uniref:Dynamin-type G domain-containing protein n=2 Tax=Corethron hystrix TaxID=216773 RepID=A0A6U5DHR2_9STRA|mmetsp:Transcript_12259/g.26791  ORF Transcript_12259/g.26791 Transcript_12259/m.26791 type:complete len:526 (+) Transcript_12259:132-1709(+)|eukprot:CAMPEP_0113320340 /NCGR_PEP_ID=MMETSP0010_2-20120614/14197_1 /TAXON_ID=216773 ORGANISM="Corethron hystrix, Strain 308" /NCGR_SAMPLE_ID=MMETSP0010_2 /ASSEMBLY_ACC=CAM_ASM_000155 /LENGTH=525 /DNA_ID=CAMNT_0000178121 /DNA_START=43 /DNA_END=1620 /DNA_ORIENTATION=+ /assembly_acc=CAM_ASM_000155